MTHDAHVGAQRLLDAAELLIAAMNSREGMNTLIPVLLDQSDARLWDASGPYAMQDLIEAMVFLQRLGLMSVQPGSGAPKLDAAHRF